ncbi:MAG: hypothetical protein QME57_01445 [Patescibacteria group bacterium]|nr:hypothetical protein [Patescibacteria group bacterium]
MLVKFLLIGEETLWQRVKKGLNNEEKSQKQPIYFLLRKLKPFYSF